jgi:hypothetical protein
MVIKDSRAVVPFANLGEVAEGGVEPRFDPAEA